MSERIINHVSDTALWVASSRAIETKRPDALFRDPYAEKLCGSKGFLIANDQYASNMVSWSVIIRTVIIDSFILNLLKENKIDTILNLGAGLDTRPYRLDLPKKLTWIEVDFPHMIEHKENILQNDNPNCYLQRFKLDLANREERKSFFKEISKKASHVLILTEGVLPYLTNEDVSFLAQDLFEHKNFDYWIAEYFSPRSLQHLLTNKKRIKKMEKAPFKFSPDEWFSFFYNNGWKEVETKYYVCEGTKLNRRAPFPLWFKIIHFFLNNKMKESNEKMSGYTLFRPKHF